jgi:T-complex protein 1 subunit theta
VLDALETGILDHLVTKQTAVRLAVNAAVTILRISQIIMSKPCDVPIPGGSSGGTMGSMDQDAAM